MTSVRRRGAWIEGNVANDAICAVIHLVMAKLDR